MHTVVFLVISPLPPVLKDYIPRLSANIYISVAVVKTEVIFSHDRITILSRTIGLQGWMSDVVCPLFSFLHDGITFERFKLQG